MTQDFSHLGENSMFCLFAAGLHDSILKFASKYNNLFNLGSVKDFFLSKNKGTEFPNISLVIFLCGRRDFLIVENACLDSWRVV